MKRIFFAVVLGMAALAGASAVNAQSYEGYGYSAPQRHFVGPIYNYPQPGWGMGWRYHSSSYEQGVLMGMAELYRGVGEYNVANSIAAYNWQLARNAALQNNIAERAARAQMYASMRAGQARRAEEDRKKNIARAKFNANRPVERLTSTQINRATGKVSWPALLTQAEFDENRAAVEHALTQKYQNHNVSMADADAMLLAAVTEFQDKLEENREEYRPSDYYAARSFLRRMKQEVDQQTEEPSARLASASL
jgi:hypothetical protein